MFRIFAQSTQARHEVQKFPRGSAVRIAPRSRIVGGTHILNVTNEPIENTLTMRLTLLPEDEVETSLTILHLVYQPIRLPPHQTTLLTGDCAFSKVQDAPFAAELYYVLPHYHGLGSGFQLQVLGGARDGEEFFRVEGFSAEPRGRMFDPPISLAGADGIRFGCEYMNSRDEEVGWGVGTQEMCEMLAFIRSDYYYEGRVLEENRSRMENGIGHHSGECDMVAVPAGERKSGTSGTGAPTFAECTASGPEQVSNDCMRCVCELGPTETVGCNLACWGLVDCVQKNCKPDDIACITDYCRDLLDVAPAATTFGPIITQCADRCSN